MMPTGLPLLTTMTEPIRNLFIFRTASRAFAPPKVPRIASSEALASGDAPAIAAMTGAVFLSVFLTESPTMLHLKALGKDMAVMSA